MLNRVFEAMSHVDRRKLLALLKREGELHAGAIVEHFDFTKPTLSHHLKILTDAGLLDREKRGQFVYYRINISAFEETLGALIHLFDNNKRTEGATDETGDRDMRPAGSGGAGDVPGGLEPDA